MKTVTIDYDLYQKELQDAKLAGAEITKNLKEELIDISNGIQSYDRVKYDEASRKLYNLIRKLSE